MKKRISTYILALFIFSNLSCKSQENKKSEIIQKPKSFKVLEEIEGDLDKDGISEKVIVYDTKKEIDLGTERQIYIYKRKNNNWKLWKKSIGAILPSEHGGMMGDPFEGISIERNCIVISHFGGSRQKWNYTHRFRFQSGEFQLIGATVNFGSPCDYFERLDYNLSNGKVKYEKEIENCEKETSKIVKKEMIRKLESLPTMNGFYPGDNEIKFSNSEITMYY
ncbi:hypothetical protein [Tenacibaculum piscium]|uniref:hypothetical protein n=1 Tax=Tenacibaculum piscium TaxID=1458515 RepID=UPI001EFB454D|nr:hypothetical protein [Tenacibaculum piscium]MCG8184431.1 hypothetical protein [Tenacibaculum piscium]MCG8205831.1 hypothetical protein [Tenacibaculum piscium]